VAKHLKLEAHKFEIPVEPEIRIWRGIRPLTPETHYKYQTLAITIAKAMKTKRVHLDSYFYRKADNE